MIKPSSWSSREEALLLLNAYLDGELDASAALDVERRMQADAGLKAEYDRLSNLRMTIASCVAKDQASETLRRRIAGIADDGGPATVPARPVTGRFEWRQMAAAAVVASCLASGATYLTTQPDPESAAMQAIIADHQRSLLAAAPVDVTSSDRHTVKPWFDRKLALSPQIVDLAPLGFPLLGGRVEVIAGEAVPVQVYQRHGHLISVTAIPRAGGSDDGSMIMAGARDGYAVREWRGHDFVYYAVSDVSAKELDLFVASWRRQAAAE